MAHISTVKYQGDLRNEAEHLRSGQKIITDAPTDNNGKGEAFSPTDLLATALASCALTVMGIRARNEGFDFEFAQAQVQKEMASNPRRVEAVRIHIQVKANCDTKMRAVLEAIGRSCPVAKSLAPELEQDLSFEWLD